MQKTDFNPFEIRQDTFCEGGGCIGLWGGVKR